jgi:hypothetical protein
MLALSPYCKTTPLQLKKVKIGAAIFSTSGAG